MADMGTREAAEKWGYTQETIRRWCADGKIENATQDKKGSPWHIPKNAKCAAQFLPQLSYIAVKS